MYSVAKHLAMNSVRYSHSKQKMPLLTPLLDEHLPEGLPKKHWAIILSSTW